jgi:hypothetical protein
MIITGIRIKMAHFQMLPWVLLGLAHYDDTEVQKCARRALGLRDKGAAALVHTQSRRFLDADWRGLHDGDEQPLVDIVS